jgi:hypothetical protein
MSAQCARRGQIALGLLWLVDGLLQFQPSMFGRFFVTGVLLPSAVGQPRFIAAPLTWTAQLIGPHVALFNGLAATLEVLLGVGLLRRSTAGLALVISTVWALAVWSGGEGFGMLLTGTASPSTGAPGAALLYVWASLMCLPGRASGRREERRLIWARPLWSAFWLGSAAWWLLAANRPADSIALAALSAAIGLAIAAGWCPRTVVAAQILLSVLYWILGQDLGGVFTGHATDVGTAPLVVLIAVIVPRPGPGHAKLVAGHGVGVAVAGSSRAHNTTTMSGSNWVPAHRRSSASASGSERADW